MYLISHYLHACTVKPVLRGHPCDKEGGMVFNASFNQNFSYIMAVCDKKWSLKTGDLLKEVQINSQFKFHYRTRKR